MIVAIEQAELVDEDVAQSKAMGIWQSFGQDRAMNAEDNLEVLVEVFRGQRAEFMEGSTNAEPGQSGGRHRVP